MREHDGGGWNVSVWMRAAFFCSCGRNDVLGGAILFVATTTIHTKNFRVGIIYSVYPKVGK